MLDFDQQFDSRPQAVKDWLENLPFAHVGEMARQLYTAMRDVNHQEDVPVKHYFHMFEGISQPLSMILPELHKHYAGKPLPLSNKRRKVADLYMQLLRQTIDGYQRIISQSVELGRFGWKKVVTTSVHRIFYYSCLMLSNYRQLYLPFPKGTWQRTYWTFQLVEKYDLLNVKVVNTFLTNKKTSIADEFKKLLLHTLLSPNLFKPKEFNNVIANMDTWIRYVNVSDTLKNKHDQVYAFTLETDCAPGLMGEESLINIDQIFEIEMRYLDISVLLQHINKLLTLAKPGQNKIKLTRSSMISRRALLLLLNSWGRPANRDSERHAIQGQAEVAIGVSAINYIISDGRAHIPDASETSIDLTDTNSSTVSDAGFTVINTQQDTTLTSSSHIGFSTESDENKDVWDNAYFEPEPTPPSWTESIRMKAYSYLHAKVLNISQGGFCVAIPQDKIEHIQMNELIAIRGKNDHWQLGKICWMVCPTNGPIRAGIKKLSSKLVAAELNIQTDNQHAQPIKCLLGQNKSERILFLPNIPTSLDGKKLQLDISGVKRRFTLIEQISSSPVGSSYYIEWRDSSSSSVSSSDSEDSLDAVWASL